MNNSHHQIHTTIQRRCNITATKTTKTTMTTRHHAVTTMLMMTGYHHQTYTTIQWRVAQTMQLALSGPFSMSFFKYNYLFIYWLNARFKDNTTTVQWRQMMAVQQWLTTAVWHHWTTTTMNDGGWLAQAMQLALSGPTESFFFFTTVCYFYIYYLFYSRNKNHL